MNPFPKRPTSGSFEALALGHRRWRTTDTVITEAELPTIEWEQFGHVVLVDGLGSGLRELAMPHELLIRKGGHRKAATPPRRRLVVYVANADDPAAAKRIFIALTATSLR